MAWPNWDIVFASLPAARTLVSSAKTSLAPTASKAAAVTVANSKSLIPRLNQIIIEGFMRRRDMSLPRIGKIAPARGAWAKKPSAVWIPTRPYTSWKTILVEQITPCVIAMETNARTTKVENVG